MIRRPPLLLLLTIIPCAVFGGRIYPLSSQKTSSLVTPPQARALEASGLTEFSPGLVEIEITTPEERSEANKMIEILGMIGDGKDSLKNEQAIKKLNAYIEQFPANAEAHAMRAMLEFSLKTIDYDQILHDISETEELNRQAAPAKAALITTADLYVMRAKVHLLNHQDRECISDLQTAIISDPSKSVFNNGGVKPETETSNFAAFQKRDFDYLVGKYPTDFRTYMARGLFYESFTSYSELYFTPAFADLNRAAALNHNSALVEFLLGSLYQQTTFFTKEAWRDTSESGGFKDQQNKIALPYLERATSIEPTFIEAWAQQAEALYSLRRYDQAISRYNKVIELDPKHWGAYNDRALAKFYNHDYYAAISDFTEALDVKTKNQLRNTPLDNTYESRADAYVKVRDFDNAATEVLSRFL